MNTIFLSYEHKLPILAECGTCKNITSNRSGVKTSLWGINRIHITKNCSHLHILHTHGLSHVYLGSFQTCITLLTKLCAHWVSTTCLYLDYSVFYVEVTNNGPANSARQTYNHLCQQSSLHERSLHWMTWRKL